jgi:chromosome segregation protein
MELSAPVYLKNLEIQGFKSFPDKIKIGFDEGMTAIVGPNGSGKSNICDAIRWVLGEQSTRTLRGAKMEDVIFNGTQKRTPVGFAEVSLTIDNTRRLIGVDYDELTVTPVTTGLGERVFLNRKPMRLKDIHEIFHGYRPPAGRLFPCGAGGFPRSCRPGGGPPPGSGEAAGITKYRYRKSESERKLFSDRGKPGQDPGYHPGARAADRPPFGAGGEGKNVSGPPG